MPMDVSGSVELVDSRVTHVAAGAEPVVVSGLSARLDGNDLAALAVDAMGGVGAGANVGRVELTAKASGLFGPRGDRSRCAAGRAG